MFWGLGLILATLRVVVADDVLIAFSETQQFPGNLGDRETTSSHCRGTDEYEALQCTDAVAFLSYRRDPLIDITVNASLPWVGPFAQLIALNTSQLFVETDQCTPAGLDPAAALLINSFAEAGVIAPGDLFWSGTTASGCASEKTCNEWQSASSCSAGMAGSGSTRTIASLYGVAPQWCSQLRRLICVCIGGTPLGTGSPSTLSPTSNPTQFPTFSPATEAPTKAPSTTPTTSPSKSPSIAPTTSFPTLSPTQAPLLPSIWLYKYDTSPVVADFTSKAAADAVCVARFQTLGLPCDTAELFIPGMDMTDVDAYPTGRFNPTQSVRVASGMQVGSSWADFVSDTGTWGDLFDAPGPGNPNAIWMGWFNGYTCTAVTLPNYASIGLTDFDGDIRFVGNPSRPCDEAAWGVCIGWQFTASPTQTPTKAPSIAPTTSTPTVSPTNAPTSSPIGDGSTWVYTYSPTTVNANFGGIAAADAECVTRFAELDLPCDVAKLMVQTIAGETVLDFGTSLGVDFSKNVRAAAPGSPIINTNFVDFAAATAPTISYSTAGLMPSASPVRVWGGLNAPTPLFLSCTDWTSSSGVGNAGRTTAATTARFFDITIGCGGTHYALCMCGRLTASPTAAPVTDSPTTSPTSSPVGDGSTFILPYSPTTHNGNFGGTPAARLVCIANYQALNLPCDDAALLVAHTPSDLIQNFPAQRGFDASKNVRFAVPGSPIVAANWPTFAPVTLAPAASPLSYVSLGLVPSASPVTRVWGGWNPLQSNCAFWIGLFDSSSYGSTQVDGAGRFYDGGGTAACTNSYWAMCACWKFTASPTATPTGTPTTSFPTADPTRAPSASPTTSFPTTSPTTSTPTRAPAPVVITMGRRGTSQTVPTSTTTTLSVPSSDPVTQVGTQTLTYAPTGVFAGTGSNVYLVVGYAKATYTGTDTLQYYQAYLKTTAATVTSFAAQLGGFAANQGSVGTGLVVAAIVRTASSSDTLELQVRQGTGNNLNYGEAWPVGPTVDGSSGSSRIRAFQMPSGTIVTARRHTTGCQGAINGAPAALLFDTIDTTTATGTSEFTYSAGKFTVNGGEATRPYFFSATTVYAVTGGGGFRWAWFNANVAGFGTFDGSTSLSVGTATAAQCTSSTTSGVILLAAADWIQFAEQQNSGGDLCMAPTSCSAGLADHYLQRQQMMRVPPHVLGMRTTTTQSLSANTNTLLVFGSNDASASIGSPTVAYSAGVFTFSATRTFLITGATGTSGCGSNLVFIFWIKYTPFGGAAQDMASFSGLCLSGNYVAGNLVEELQVNSGDTVEFYARATAAATINTFVYNTYAGRVGLTMMN